MTDPQYFADCKNALLEFGREHQIPGWVHIAKNIPGKLYKAKVLFDETESITAVKLCLIYAETRQQLIADGIDKDKAGDEALTLLISKLDDLYDESEVKEPVTEINQSQDDLGVNEWELTTFINDRGTAPFVSKKTGLTYTASLQSRGDNPYALIDMIHKLDEIAEVILSTGNFEVNYEALYKTYREMSEANGTPYQPGTIPQRPRNELDDYFDDQPQKPAQPKGNVQPANNGNDKVYEISGVEVIKSKNNKIGYKFLRSYKDKDGNLKQVAIMPGAKAEYRNGTAEVILKALGFTAEAISALEIGDRKHAKNRGVMAEYELQDNPQNPAHPVTQVTAYRLPDGKIIK